MVRMLIRAGIFLGTAAIGVLLAALFAGPGFHVSPTGFLVAVVVFAIAQSLITPLVGRMGRSSGQALTGVLALVSTGLALFVATLFPGGITISNASAWVIGTLVVWLVSALGGWLLPMWLLKEKVAGRRS